jgi:hypothetical protein
MATQPPPGLPILYNDLIPVQSNLHGKYQTRPAKTAHYFANHHAIPLTADEFIHAQRSSPIVFSAGEQPVPLALMGLNEGVNIFIDDEGQSRAPFYIPAYVRRYPFMLARLTPDAQELSLCFDPTSESIGEFKDGNPLFEDDKPTQNLNDILKFCEDFEVAAQRTQGLVAELKALDLLMDGEVSIQPTESEQPFIYRGFQMVSEEKLRDMNGDQLRKLNQNGILPLIFAHIFSLSHMSDLFSAQMAQGKVPIPEAEAAPAEA